MVVYPLESCSVSHPHWKGHLLSGLWQWPLEQSCVFGVQPQLPRASPQLRHCIPNPRGRGCGHHLTETQFCLSEQEIGRAHV